MDSSTDLEWWREYFGSAKVGVFEIIRRALDLAISDFRGELRLERDDTKALLALSALQVQQRTLNLDEELDCSTLDQVHYKDPHEIVSNHVPISGFDDDVVGTDETKVPNRSTDEGAKLEPRKRPIIRIKYRSKEIGLDHKKGVPQKQLETTSVDEKSGCLKSFKQEDFTSGAASENRGLAKPPSNCGNKMQVKLEGAKRKLRDAYDRVDLAKRVRRTQFLDFSEVRSLQAKKVHQVPTKRRQQQSTILNCRSLIR